MPLSDPQDVLEYYRGIWPVVCRHAERGTLITLAATWPTDLDAVLPPTPEELFGSESSPFGVVAVVPGRIVLHIRPGEGADVATAATATLDLAEQLAADGLVPVPLTDGSGGLLLMATSVGDVGVTAARYARGIADRAPELATLDPGQADGRCAVLTAWDPVPTGTGWPGSGRPGTGWSGSGRPGFGWSGSGSGRPDTGLPETGPSDRGPSESGPAPVPYSLVAGSAGIEPVIPLHLDEVAAVAAGMPLEPQAADVLIRLATRGDLAAALLDEATA